MEEVKKEIVNDGKPYYGTIPKEDIDKYATVFGEGSKELTDLLKYCFLNDIRIMACCKGHEDKNRCIPYIAFLPDEELATYLCELIDKMPIESIIVDKHKDFLRTAIFLYSDKEFVNLQRLLEEYIMLKEQGSNYDTSYNLTEDTINKVVEGNNDEYIITIKDGKITTQQHEDLYEAPISVVENSYCPNNKITSSLLSKIAMPNNNTLKKGK